MKNSRVRGETTLDVLAMLRAPARLVDPYPLYAELRQRSRVRLPTGEIVLSRYADAAAVLKDPMFRKPSLPRPPSKATRVLFQMFLLLDPPDHTRLRRVVAPAFAPSIVATLRSTATLVADRLIASVPGSFDLVRDFAYPLPLAVIGELLGVPDVDRAKIGAWSRTLTESIDDPLPLRLRELPRGVRSIVQGRSHPIAAARAAAGIVGYAKQRIADAAAGPATEFLETLDRAQHDGVISADEACATWIMMVIAGHETTANLIGNSVLALLDHPHLLARIRNDATLMSLVVDECLRYDSPVPYTGRTATEDTTINGTPIERGQTALMFMAAANRDPDPFPDPDRLDLARPQTPPHLGFASGIHFCVGSALAKLEAEIALTTLLPRLASDVHREEITRRPSVAVRGLARFPLQLAPSASTGSTP